MKEIHKLFAKEYIIDLNATAAYKRAGYKSKGNSAEANASRLLSSDKVQAYIAELQEAKMKRNEITADMVIKELALLAFSDTGDLFENNSLKHISDLPSDVTRTIQEVTSRVERTGSGEDAEYADIIKVKSYDKKGALDSLGKHFGIFEKDNSQSKSEMHAEITVKFVDV